MYVNNKAWKKKVCSSHSCSVSHVTSRNPGWSDSDISVSHKGKTESEHHELKEPLKAEMFSIEMFMINKNIYI